MNHERISNSIYISFATLESLLIFILKAGSSGAYYHGLVWLFPLFLAAIPIYRELKKVFQPKETKV